MAGAATLLFGRDREVAAVEEFVATVVDGFAALLIEGEAGIGKTAVWEAAVASARVRDYRVLGAHPAEVEADLSFVGLADLLGGVLDEVAPELPVPQRNALATALLRDEPHDEALDARTISLSLLGAVRAVAARGPVIIAVDDAHWLDRSTCAALQFVARRLREEPIGLLVARRAGGNGDDPLGLARLPPQRLTRVELGPLALDDLARLLRTRLEAGFPRPLLARLYEASGGNPFYALEIGRALARSEQATITGPLPLPANLRAAVSDRLAALSDEALEVLLVISALPRPTLADVQRALDNRETAATGLAEAEEADVVRVEGGRIAFTHPLLASTISSSTRSDKRRLLHGRLAQIAEDPEERARHLAEAAVEPDLATARALDEAGRRAAQRGAAAGAADLLERALTLAPSGNDGFVRELRLRAAQSHFESGNAIRARELLERAVGESPSGPQRAEAMRRLAAVLGETDGVEVATRLYREALGEAGESPELLSEIEWGLAWNTCRLGSAPRAYEYAQAGYERLAHVAQPGPKMAALAALAEFEFHLGMHSCWERAREAVELEERHADAVRPDFQPSMVLAWLHMRSGDLDRARPLLVRAHERTVEQGDEDARAKALNFLAQLECLAGNLRLAGRYADEGHELALQTGQRILLATLLYCKALVDTHLGRVDSARTVAQEGLELSEQVVHHWLVIRNAGVLGFLELSLDRPREALPHLERATRMLMEYGVREPGAYTGVADHAEALIALGDFDGAAPLVGWLEERGEALGRTGALVAAARCRGLTYAAAGDGEQAVSALERSLALADRLPQPLERGRTLLALGSVHRRGKRKRLARESLDAARAVFAEMGAELWRERAEAELARVGGRRPRSGELTPSERRVAELVADGLTNQEVAERAFLSVRSVESNLSKIYVKLGVRSRTELVRRLERA